MSSTYTICNNILDIPLNIEVRQVYTWAQTTDSKFILVSKNGIKYQQPGGHPEKGESINQTIIREILEETGVELVEADLKDVKFLGFYTVTEDKQTYLQLRFILKLNKPSSEYNLLPAEKDSEKLEDRINFVNSFTLEEACNVIPWLEDSEEVQSLRKNV